MIAVTVLVGGIGVIALLLWGTRQVENAITVLFMASIASGMSFQIGPAVVRIDALVALPVLAVAVLAATSSRDALRRRWLVSAWGSGLALLMTAAIASASAAEPARSNFMLANFAVGMLAALILMRVNADWPMIVRRTTWLIAIIAMASLAELAFSPGASNLTAPPQGGDGYRIRGLMLEPNLMGTLAAGWVAIMFYWRQALSRKYFVAAVIIAVASVLTNTRAAWLGLSVTAVFALWSLRGRLVLVIPLVTALASALVVSVGPALDASASGTLGWKLTNLLADDTGTGLYRVRTWEIAIDDLTQSNAWFAGLGVNSYAQHHPVDLTGAVEGYLSNIWIGWVYDAGLIGLALFCLHILSLLMLGEHRLSAVPTFATLLISASFTNPFWMIFPWLLIASVSGSNESPLAARVKQVTQSIRGRAWVPTKNQASSRIGP